jgi:glucose uptake protein
MAVAFPIGIGIAIVEGILINFIAEPKGNPSLIFGGGALITAAIVVDALAYRRLKLESNPGELRKGVLLALFGGILMGLFYYLVQRSVSLDFKTLDLGRFGPYAAVLVFSLGSFVSNFVFNGYLMAHPFKGLTAKYSAFFARGTSKLHWVGILGGVINGSGTMSSFVASKTVSPAIAYGLGCGGTRQRYSTLRLICNSWCSALTLSPLSMRRATLSLNSQLKTRCSDIGDPFPFNQKCP